MGGLAVVGAHLSESEAFGEIGDGRRQRAVDCVVGRGRPEEPGAQTRQHPIPYNDRLGTIKKLKNKETQKVTFKIYQN